MAHGTIAVQVTGGSRATLPEAPGRWFGRNVTGRLERGELRITTGSRFAGAHLAIHTPETAVMVTGTTLAVIREDAGTCVCVLEGHVHVGPPAGVMEDVAPGRRRFVFNDGRAPEMAEMRPVEHAPLTAFRAQMASVMGSREP